jgi:hypothetical protein
MLFLMQLSNLVRARNSGAVQCVLETSHRLRRNYAALGYGVFFLQKITLKEYGKALILSYGK